MRNYQIINQKFTTLCIHNSLVLEFCTQLLLHQVLALTHDWLVNFDKEKVNSVIFLDSKRASNEILLKKVSWHLL